MKNFRSILCLLLVAAMAFSLFACKADEKPGEESSKETPPVVSKGEQSVDSAEPFPTEPTSPIPADLDYDGQSSFVYDAQLGEFMQYYQTAKDELSLSKRYALMAVAEAKLLETGVLLPGRSRGGNYGIRRVVPRSGSTVLWGQDADREHGIITTTELLKKDDYVALKSLWNDVKGTGKYTEEALKYLADKGYEVKDSYTEFYTSDPKTWDPHNTSRQPDTKPVIQCIDGLLEYDNENVLQPALAESYDVSEDGKVYTFHIRHGVKWFDSQGRELGELTAKDFVDGFQHMMDCQAGLGDLVNGLVEGVDQYLAGEAGMEAVGIKAVDDYTLEYHLVSATPYFPTMVEYSPYYPLCRAFYESKGGKFGMTEHQAAVDGGTYTYGQTPNDIAYCGPYLIKNYTEKNTIVFEANPGYWNAENVQNKKLTWLYYDSQDHLKPYRDAKSGVVDGAGLNAEALEACKTDGLFDEYAGLSDTDGTSFVFWMNLNRHAYANAADETKCVSPMTDEQKLASNIALYNVHFRRAVAMAFDYAAYNAQGVGEDLKNICLRNSYTPGNFVSLSEEVTIQINGKDVTYPANTFYGEIIQDQLDADGVKIKAWDREAKTGDGFAGWCNADNAKEELAAAIEDVKANGLVISKDNPVYLDVPFFSGSEVEKNAVNALKQSIEGALDGCVVVNPVEAPVIDDLYAAGFDTDTGEEANYSIYTVSGWGPDYGDPSTYLDTILGDGVGYMTKCLGVF